MVNLICNNCGGPAVPGQILFEEHKIRIENARLKDELNRICALIDTFLGPELGIERNGYGGGSSSLGPSLSMGLDLGDCYAIPGIRSPVEMFGDSNDIQLERSVLIDLALAAMDELLKKAQADSPIWIKGLDGERDILNQEEYARFSSCIGLKPPGFVAEATRQTNIVLINSSALMEVLMDANRYADMFQSLIARSVDLNVLSSGIGGTRNGAVHLMHVEVQLLSPLVPVRQVRILRFCKQHAEDVWVVVYVSVEMGHDANSQPFISCRRLPSGCIVQDMPNGSSKVTWIEHWEYDESVVHELYHPLLISGIGFGAHRWIATLQRRCEGLAILLSSTISSDDHAPLSQAGKRSMWKLAQRMTNNFCSGVCASSERKWDSLQMGTFSNDMRFMTRNNINDPCEPPGIVLSVTTSVWMPVSRQKLFDFLRDERLRSKWDILSNGRTMQEMIHISKGQGQGNCISVIHANAVNANDRSMLILQETWMDMSCSVVVYAPVDAQSLNVLMSGGDSAYVTLLPSGFAIVPDGNDSSSYGSSNGTSQKGGGCGSLLTVGFQIMVNSLPNARLTIEYVDTVNNLISCTIQKIKAALIVA